LRESLTVLAALLILCLSIALAAPYFVDWNAQRGLIEAHLSQALGEKVSIRGDLDLKLLPTPYLHLQNIEIADDSAAARFTADDILLEIAIPPLLRGEVDFIEARVHIPRLKLTQAADGTLRIPHPEGFSGQARFERISIEDGQIEIDDPAQSRMLALDHFDLNAEAASLAGPFKGDGRGMIAGETTAFRFSTGEQEGNNLRLKLIIDKSKTHPRADFDGTLSLDQQRNGNVAASFAGNAGFSGLWHIAAGKNGIALPWQVTGPLHIAGRKAAMEMLELRIGDEDHAVTMTGKAEMDFSAAPKANVNLHASQIDIDRLLAANGHIQTPESFEQSLSALADASSLSFPVPLTLETTADTATLNSEILSGLSGALLLNEDHPVWLRFEASLPGRSHIHLDGHIERGSGTQFEGKGAASTGDMERMTTWLAGVLPHAAAQIHKLPFHAFDVSGETTLSRVGFSGRDLRLRLGRSKFEGDLSYTEPVGSEPARVYVDLSAPSLDLDGLPNLQEAAKLAQAADLSIRFDAHAVKVAGLRKGAFDTGEIRLKLTKTGTYTNLEDLTLNGIGGAAIAAKGAWTGQAGSLDAKLNAPHPGDLTEALRHIISGPWLDILDQRAAALSPMQFDVHAEAAEATGAVLPVLTALNLTGMAGASYVSAHITSDPKTPAISTASAAIDVPDSGNLLRQFGAEVLPLDNLGRGHIEIKMKGPLDNNADTTIQATLAGLNLNFHGRLDLSSSAGPAGLATNGLAANGQVKLVSTDLSPMLRATGLAFPDLTARLPADLTSDLDWNAARLDLRGLKGSFSGTPLSGFLTYAAQDGTKKVTGTLDLDRSSAGALFELALGAPQPVKSGFLWSHLAFNQGLPDPVPASITLRAKSFDILPGLSGENAALQFEIAPGVFTFRDFTMRTGKGTMAGTLILRRDGATAAISGHLILDSYSFDLPSLQGRVSAALDIAGSGQSGLALISSLAGSGHASFTGLAVRRADPAALSRIFSEVERDKLSVDEAEIERALNRELDRGALNAGEKPFDLAVAAGVLRLNPAPVQQAEPKPGTLDDFSLSFDLRTAEENQRLGLTLLTLPKDWQGSPPHLELNFKGPLSNPTRTIEAASFVNSLASRAIAREAARIQAYEFDLHERAVFNQRLQFEHRLEAEQRKTEDDARKAEAERKAEADAIRIEKLRKAEDARKAEEARKKAEELHTNAASESQPAPFPQSSNAPAPQPPGAPADPSALGRY